MPHILTRVNAYTHKRKPNAYLVERAEVKARWAVAVNKRAKHNAALPSAVQIGHRHTIHAHTLLHPANQLLADLLVGGIARYGAQIYPQHQQRQHLRDGADVRAKERYKIT